MSESHAAHGSRTNPTRPACRHLGAGIGTPPPSNDRLPRWGPRHVNHGRSCFPSRNPFTFSSRSELGSKPIKRPRAGVRRQIHHSQRSKNFKSRRRIFAEQEQSRPPGALGVEEGHGEQHIQVHLRSVRAVVARPRAPGRAPRRRRARPRRPQLRGHLAGSGWAEPARRLLRESAGELVQQAARGMEEGPAAAQDAGGSCALRRTDAQEPPESRRRGLVGFLRPAGSQRPRWRSLSRASPRGSAEASRRQVRAAHAPDRRQVGGRRRHDHRVRGRVRPPRPRQRAPRRAEGGGGARQGARRQGLPQGRRAAQDHSGRRIQAGSERERRRGAREEVHNQAEGARCAGEGDAVRQGGERDAAETRSGEEPEGLRVRRGPVR